MKRFATATFAVAFFVFGGVAVASLPTQAHKHQYQHDYQMVASKFGDRAPGRNIIQFGLASGKRATDSDVVRSLAVLERFLNPLPSPAVAYSNTTATIPSTSSATPTSTTATTATTSVAASGSLESCIISHESGGNPQATNGQYGGIGQWSPTAWAQDGGTKYASSPTGASYAQQQAVLSSEGAAGMASQQGQYDGCS